MGLKFRFTNTYSSDLFYGFDRQTAAALALHGNGVIEMEAVPLFMLGKVKGLRTDALLVVSDNVIRHTGLLGHKELEARMKAAGTAVLEALTE